MDWLQHRLIAYREAHKDAAYFRLHNYRGTAMSRARQAGASSDMASIAFGCHPETMRRYYEKLDEVAISDDVMDVLHGTAESVEV